MTDSPVVPDEYDRGGKYRPCLTCLSFNPINSTSSMSVSLGCLFRSSLSLMSRGSNAILCPFSPPVYDVSGARSLEGPARGAGDSTRFDVSSSSPVDTPPPPRRRVSPAVDAMKLWTCAFPVCRSVARTPSIVAWGWLDCGPCACLYLPSIVKSSILVAWVTDPLWDHSVIGWRFRTFSVAYPRCQVSE